MSKYSLVVESGKKELKMSPCLSLLSCELSMSVKENSDREKIITTMLLRKLPKNFLVKKDFYSNKMVTWTTSRAKGSNRTCETPEKNHKNLFFLDVIL